MVGGVVGKQTSMGENVDRTGHRHLRLSQEEQEIGKNARISDRLNKRYIYIFFFVLFYFPSVTEMKSDFKETTPVSY